MYVQRLFCSEFIPFIHGCVFKQASEPGFSEHCKFNEIVKSARANIIKGADISAEKSCISSILFYFVFVFVPWCAICFSMIG